MLRVQEGKVRPALPSCGGPRCGARLGVESQHRQVVGQDMRAVIQQASRCQAVAERPRVPGGRKDRRRDETVCVVDLPLGESGLAPPIISCLYMPWEAGGARETPPQPTSLLNPAGGRLRAAGWTICCFMLRRDPSRPSGQQQPAPSQQSLQPSLVSGGLDKEAINTIRGELDSRSNDPRDHTAINISLSQDSTDV